MFRNGSSGQSPASSPGHGGASPGLDGQESPWLGLVSVLSRPALSLLNRILPGRTQTAALSDPGPGWLSGVLDELESGPQGPYLRGEPGGAAESGRCLPLPWLPDDSLGGLEDLEDLNLNFCQHSQLRSGSTVSTALHQVLGQARGGKDWWSGGSRVSGGHSFWWGGEGAPAEVLLQDVLWTGATAQQLCPQQTANQATIAESAPNSWTGAESSGALDHQEKAVLHPQESTPDHQEKAVLHPQGSTPDHQEKAVLHPQGSTPEHQEKAVLHPDLNPQGSTPDHQEKAVLHPQGSTPDHQEKAVLNPQGSTPDHQEKAVLHPQGSTPDHQEKPGLHSQGSTPDHQEKPGLHSQGSTPDQDHGYSSLEEEQVQQCPLLMATPPNGEVQQQEGEEQSVVMETEEEQEVLTAPRCQNKAIAFIMGCPCSDDDDSQSEDEEDGGFVGEGWSDSSEDDEDSDEELDEESEHLWSSMSRSLDPYNPQNFSARLHSGTTSSSSLQPRDIPASTSSFSSSSQPRDIPASSSTSSSSSQPRDIPASTSSFSSSSQPRDIPASSSTSSSSSSQPRDIPASTSSSSSSSSQPRDIPASYSTSSSQPRDIPASCSPPDQGSSSFSSSSSSSSSSWDDSTSASEVDEAESLHLWSSFSCSSDPYSPFNFQAPLRTLVPPAAPLRTLAPPAAPLRAGVRAQTPAAAPPQYRKEGAEERLDSGFSEPCTSSDGCRDFKKVRFSDHVEEFFASGGEEEEEEDRRGPWEEFARDRCRFLRRCLEVEQSIAFCLQPQHRLRIYQRLTVLQR